MRPPAFHYRRAGLASFLLLPFALIYGAVAGWRLGRPGKRAAVPVVCVGNPTMGGAGKTPTALAVAKLLAEAGERPAFVTRGYGGSAAGPLRVDAARHSAADVGDEPLLLARAFPTVVARDRVAGAALAAAEGASVIVLDDGFQNPSLAKDLALLVVDGERGIGNGDVFPAGPLRAPLAAQLARAHGLVRLGRAGASAPVEERAKAAGLPVFAADLVPDPAVAKLLSGTKLLAFAGIGHPEKFFATLEAAGAIVTEARRFADHHRYSAEEARALLDAAARARLMPVTTEKDLARMEGDPALAELASRATALPVQLRFRDAGAMRALLAAALAKARG